MELIHIFGERKVIVGVDLLEEKKGIPQKFMAFNKFLQLHPEWASRCVFIQVSRQEEVLNIDKVVPDKTQYSSREQDPDNELLQQIYQMVGEINSTFGSIGHLPVHFLHQKFGAQDLVPLYARADV